MNIAVLLVTSITWVLYFGYRVIDALKCTKTNRFDISWIKENFIRMLHLEELLLIAIFVYFSTHGLGGVNKTVYEALFIVINLYLYINEFYDQRKKINTNLNTEDLGAGLLVVLSLIIPVLFYIKNNDLITTYYILFGYSFMSFIIVFISRTIIFLIRKIIKR